MRLCDHVVLSYNACICSFLQAWSSIVYLLIPNVKKIEKSLNTFANIIDADEVLLFEKASFLVGGSSIFIYCFSPTHDRRFVINLIGWLFVEACNPFDTLQNT